VGERVIIRVRVIIRPCLRGRTQSLKLRARQGGGAGGRSVGQRGGAGGLDLSIVHVEVYGGIVGAVFALSDHKAEESACIHARPESAHPKPSTHALLAHTSRC
jgi:hypothetical protein